MSLRRILCVLLCAFLVSCQSGDSINPRTQFVKHSQPPIQDIYPAKQTVRIVVQQVAGYPLVRSALASETCYGYLRFPTGAKAIDSFDRTEFLYNSAPDNPRSVAYTDYSRIWLHPLFFNPQSLRVTLQGGRQIDGLQLWDQFFELEFGFFSLARFQAMALLHEFAHAQFVTRPDSELENSGAGELNTIEVVENCFPGWVSKEVMDRRKSEAAAMLRRTKTTK